MPLPAIAFSPQTFKIHHPNPVQHQVLATVRPIFQLVAFPALQASESSYRPHHTNATRCDRYIQHISCGMGIRACPSCAMFYAE